MSWFSAARARLLLIFAGRAAQSRMDEELAFHIDMETERLMREEQLPRAEARRRTIATFGGATQHAESLRDGRGLAWLGGMSLDLKLGVRMLVKYPGLTIVGGLAMAFSIWVGAIVFEMVRVAVNPTLPLPGGDRIVKIATWNVAENRAEPRALHDFTVWRASVRSITDLGAYSDVTRNLIVVPGGEARRIKVAEIMASGFRIAPTAPLLGRVLVEADERPDAPPVVLLGYDVWRTRFASDANVIGRSVQIDERFAEVVGVMPEKFAFPIAHEMWVPMRVTATDRLPRSGASVTVFGRLAPGVTLEDAQAELTVIGKRMSAELRETHQHLQPRVRPYTSFWNVTGSDYALMQSFNVFALMLVVLLCSNVALLLFARAATREAEIVVRSALGASRRRIVAQLFAEALVLGGVAAAVGLAAVAVTLRLWGREFFVINQGTVPFWINPGLSLPTILYAILLTVIAAAVAGVIPGLKVTHGIGARLKQGTAGSGLRFGGIWTAVIVAQVAITVAVPAILLIEQRELRRIHAYDGGFATEEYLAVRLEMHSGRGSPDTTRYANALEVLRQRVAAEPGVLGVTLASNLPRLGHPESYIELTGSSGDAAPPASALPRVDIAYVDPTYFNVLESPVGVGRAFNAGDLAEGARVAIVDEGFVDRALSGRNPIGRQLRFTPRPDAPAGEKSSWFEIVGVVKDLGMGAVHERERAAGVYLPALATRGPLNLVVHVRKGSDPLSFAPRLRMIATSVDPTLRLAEPQRLDDVADDVLWIIGLWLRITATLTGIALLLSLAGIYAVLSFAVSRRTREIGVRVALGASRRRVLTAIFRRPLTQVAFGVALGSLLVGALVTLAAGQPDQRLETARDVMPSFQGVALLCAYAVVMLGVCLLACIVPTRRALRVEPTVALRSD
jgi:putative ABC transport system permease protein